MKKKFFIVFVIFLFLFLFVLGYKFFGVGNNKTIESISQVDEYVLNIKNYNVEAKVTVSSNKNSNTYNLKQYKMDDYQRQEIISDEESYGLVIENDGNRLIVKNTGLDLASVFENYDEVTSNSTGLDSFIDDYRNSEQTEVTEDEEYYMLFVKVKNSQNRYIENKTLYVNKKNGELEKIEVRDINNNRTIFIEYTRFEIL